MSVVTLGSNIASLKAQRQLGKATADVRTVSERLASGLRINHASDDAAGLSIASTLNADRRVFEQGVRNLNDGISLLNVADGATEQLSTILIRLKELAEQAANGTYGVKQRKALDSEAQALSKEYFRIVQTTSFNGQSLFSPAFGQLRLQGGYGSTGGIQGTLGGAVGTGALGTSANLSMTSNNTSTPIAYGDVNGDGKIDLVSLDAVSLGRGDGTFQVSSSLGAGNRSVQLADMNNDGMLDVLYNRPTGFGVTLGNGDGTFRQEQSYTSAVGSYSIAAADFNGDGILDIARGLDTIEVRLGRGDGTFGPELDTLLNSHGHVDYSVGDLNGDGYDDLAMVSIETATDDPFTTVLIGRGDGTFSTSLSFAEANLVYAVKLADLNNDKILDLVSGLTDGMATVRLGRGNGTFGAAASYFLEGASDALTAGDMNGDGFLDLLSMGGESGVLSIAFGNGNGSFGRATTYDVGSQTGDFVLTADMNNDGVLDVVGGGRNTTVLWLGNSTSGISPLHSFSLNSRANALQALSQFDLSLKRINTQRGTIGALQSRVSTAIGNLQTGIENYAAAASRITDADFASESANLVRSKIIQFASVSILAQANAQPALALKLLADID